MLGVRILDQVPGLAGRRSSVKSLIRLAARDERNPGGDEGEEADCEADGEVEHGLALLQAGLGHGKGGRGRRDCAGDGADGGSC